MRFAEDMFLLGILHDFGYEFAENPSDHPAVGAEILKRQGYRYWKEVADHGNINVTEATDALFVLSCADMTTGPHGESFTMEDRIDNMAQRYGRDSRQHKKAIVAAERLRSDPRYRLLENTEEDRKETA